MKEVNSRNKVLLCLPINIHVYFYHVTDGHLTHCSLRDIELIFPLTVTCNDFF